MKNNSNIQEMEVCPGTSGRRNQKKLNWIINRMISSSSIPMAVQELYLATGRDGGESEQAEVNVSV